MGPPILGCCVLFHGHNPPQEEVDSWMRAEDNARVLIELLEGAFREECSKHQFLHWPTGCLEAPNDHRYVRGTSKKVIS